MKIGSIDPKVPLLTESTRLANRDQLSATQTTQAAISATMIAQMPRTADSLVAPNFGCARKEVSDAGRTKFDIT